jgi:hypothetical protein
MHSGCGRIKEIDDNNMGYKEHIIEKEAGSDREIDL